MTSRDVPDPSATPTLRVWPEVGEILGLSKVSTYAAVKRGDIPTIRFGRRIVVPTAALRRLLQIDGASEG